jgi:hypothetical protein
MGSLRIAFVLSVLGFVAALLMAGCASAGSVIAPSAAEVQITVHPWVKPVRIVARRLSRERYVYVGRVRAVARDAEFVAAARAVDEQLRTQARTLGADVVKIDQVSPGRHLVLLAGRCYRALD